MLIINNCHVWQPPVAKHCPIISCLLTTTTPFFPPTVPPAVAPRECPHGLSEGALVVNTDAHRLCRVTTAHRCHVTVCRRSSRLPRHNCRPSPMWVAQQTPRHRALPLIPTPTTPATSQPTRHITIDNSRHITADNSRRVTVNNSNNRVHEGE